MTGIYGHKWISSYGVEPSDTWARGLRGFTNDELAHGIRRCLDREDPWPPTLPEFRQLCRPRRETYHSLYTPLSVLAAPLDVAREHLSRIRNALRGEKP